jgi:uncharacterized surface protein with fasciclin (FAS1) repeats
MKLNTLRRGTAAAAILTLSLGFAACGSEDEEPTGGTETSEAAPEETEEAPEETTPAEEPSTEFAVFGDGCAEVPTDPADEGSLEGMVDDPVGTAASNNPILTQLVGAVTAAGLVDTLNSAPALTVFAPFDGAFAELGPTAGDLITQAEESDDPTTSPLATVLTHHVVEGQLDPAAVVGEQQSLAGTPLTIEGDAESGMTVSDGTVTANVICGNVPTANATVYVIDKVLTAPAAG